MEYEVKDLSLAAEGKRRIEWAEQDMPVLSLLRKRFEEEKPFAGKRLSACLHVTAETANLARSLKAGGAEVMLVASNPLSTQDDVAAALVKEYGISVFSIRGEEKDMYYAHIRKAIEFRPHVTMDDGADLITSIHFDYPNQVREILGSMEETTTGVIRLRAMAKDNSLRIPVIAVNDAKTKNLFDNRYGTGQSTVDGIIRATDILLAGKTVVVAGYGWCGRGFAARCKGMGSHVIITEVDPIKAIEAAMDGFQVMPMIEAAKLGDLFCTLTGDIHVLRKEHYQVMKDRAILANSGHFNVEIDIEALKKMAKKTIPGVRKNVDAFVLPDDRTIYLLAEGRLINLAAAEGHPASVMDMSFSTQALCAEWVVKAAGKLDVRVHDVPVDIEDWVSRLKLESMGLRIDELTGEQKEYLSSWKIGT